jgi:hypothetical protein
VIRKVTWLSSEGDVLWENTINWWLTTELRGHQPTGDVFLDAGGAKAALAKIERAPLDRPCVVYFAHHCDAAIRAMDGWEDFVWRTFGEFVALLQRAAADHERLLVGFVFSEPPVSFG